MGTRPGTRLDQRGLRELAAQSSSCPNQHARHCQLQCTRCIGLSRPQQAHAETHRVVWIGRLRPCSLFAHRRGALKQHSLCSFSRRPRPASGVYFTASGLQYCQAAAAESPYADKGSDTKQTELQGFMSTSLMRPRAPMAM